MSRMRDCRRFKWPCSLSPSHWLSGSSRQSPAAFPSCVQCTSATRVQWEEDKMQLGSGSSIMWQQREWERAGAYVQAKWEAAPNRGSRALYHDYWTQTTSSAVLTISLYSRKARKLPARRLNWWAQQTNVISHGIHFRSRFHVPFPLGPLLVTQPIGCMSYSVLMRYLGGEGHD